MQSINLIPQQEAQEQTKTKVVKLSTVFSIFILLAVGSISGYFFYRTSKLKADTKEIDEQIGKLRSEINSLAPVEISARNLDKKYAVLKDILGTRSNYSLLGEEFKVRMPAGVSIESLTLQKSSKINVSGIADNYILISSFMNNLLNAEFVGGNPELNGIFTSVALNSVSLEKQKNLVRFSINVDIDAARIKEK